MRSDLNKWILHTECIVWFIPLFCLSFVLYLCDNSCTCTFFLSLLCMDLFREFIFLLNFFELMPIKFCLLFRFLFVLVFSNTHTCLIASVRTLHYVTFLLKTGKLWQKKAARCTVLNVLWKRAVSASLMFGPQLVDWFNAVSSDIPTVTHYVCMTQIVVSQYHSCSLLKLCLIEFGIQYWEQILALTRPKRSAGIRLSWSVH